MARNQSDRVFRILTNRVAFAVGRLQLRTYQALTSGTPVDTGFARGGWAPTTGEPERPDGRGRDARGRFTSGVARPSNRAEAQARAAVNLARHRQAAAQIALTYAISQGKVFIVNPVSYIDRLNAGSSAQAPAMFVESAIADAVKATRAELAALG